ncbi:putative six-hairpin glycosidase superfamily [Septoria linicola]|nr:putative six-hairpin glycosidase superfamily [Septoria linicola]
MASTVVAHPSKVKLSPHLYDENIAARIWRTALRGAPEEGGNGWPMYTHGAHNNTRVLQDDPDHKPGAYVYTSASGWTAGFFPNSLWQLYHRKKNLLPHSSGSSHGPSLEEWLSVAQAWTDPLITNQNLTTIHDIGFLANPFGSALHFNNETKWLPILSQMSTNLASRYVPSAGVLRSWDNKNSSFSQNASHSDSVLVIIDNMMNLPLLARSAATYSGNKTLLDIAISHADQTMKHHIRDDGSTYHVCDYSATTGELYLCRTAQGLADEKIAMKVADWFLEHLPDDGVPYWDFSVVDPQAGITPRA